MKRAWWLWVCLALSACKTEPAPPIAAPFEDDFERTALGTDYLATAANYQLINGALSSQGALNHPLWLRRALPDSVAIEFDAWSNSEDGDIKIELNGDGHSHATDQGAYRATGYVIVFGGWNNTKSIIARQDEHGRVGVDIVQRTEPKVEKGARYRFRIERMDRDVRWFVDDMATPFLAFTDPSPLAGAGHSYFAFNNWKSDVWFDNLRITPSP